MTNTDQYKFLQGGGEMGELIRNFAWEKTPIGAVANWPIALKNATGILLSTPFPMYIAWGKEFTQLYNDGYRPILGSVKHPFALGGSTVETFAEIWNLIGPMFNGVLEGRAIGFPNFKLDLNRHGYVEECWFDFSYSPIPDEHGVVGGVLVTVIETTERIKAEASLKRAKAELEMANAASENQRERLKRFFMEAPAGICILDGPQLTFELINPGYQQFFPGRQLLGKPLLEAIPEIKDQPIHHIIQEVYDTGKTFEGNALKIPLASHDNGPVEDRYFNFIYQARLDAKGSSDGIMVFAFEVTEMVEGRILLAESEKRFRGMVEQSPVPMLVTIGPDMIFAEINERMLNLLNKDASVTGKPIYEILPELKDQPVMQHLFHTYHTGETWTGNEVPVSLNRDGKESLAYFNVSYKALYENQKIIGVLQAAMEVTEQVTARRNLEKAEDTLKLSLAAARLGTFDLDFEKDTLEWDKRCRELFGVAHENEVGYEEDFVAALHPEDRERILDIINNKVLVKAVSNGHYDVEYRTIGLNDKKVRWLKALGKAYFNEEGKPIRFLGAALDITEAKLNELRKNDFIGIVSHELKTPLTSLKGYVQFAEQHSLSNGDELMSSLMAKADTQLVKMNRLIHGFLNLSRLESGKIFLEKTSFDLCELTSQIVGGKRIISPAHQIIFDSEVPVHVFADRDKIESVVSNLVNNAIKYSPSGGEIIINCIIQNGKAVFTIRDFGIGIKQQDIQKIFERYYRVDNSHTATISGFGIGLYLSAEIIHRHSGEIRATSEEGKGSTFEFTIPLV